MNGFVSEMRDRMEKCYDIAREHLQISSKRRKKAYDLKVKKTEFITGDWLCYYYPRKYRQRSPKRQIMYTGPYLVIRVIEPVNYVLQKSARAKAFVVHADKLKKCNGTTPESWLKNDHVVQSEQSQNECFLNVSNDIFEEEQDESNNQINLLNKDTDLGNVENVRTKRQNLRKPKRFEDYQM